mmetsp:Transcript_45439/g.131137  ORF Transcript_45439/g.131137 Transcript_45439/m.131137 type:complete len:280 (+) Transcript_45439:68-907(+)
MQHLACGSLGRESRLRRRAAQARATDDRYVTGMRYAYARVGEFCAPLLNGDLAEVRSLDLHYGLQRHQGLRHFRLLGVVQREREEAPGGVAADDNHRDVVLAVYERDDPGAQRRCLGLRAHGLELLEAAGLCGQPRNELLQPLRFQVALPLDEAGDAAHELKHPLHEARGPCAAANRVGRAEGLQGEGVVLEEHRGLPSVHVQRRVPLPQLLVGGVGPGVGHQCLVQLVDSLSIDEELAHVSVTKRLPILWIVGVQHCGILRLLQARREVHTLLDVIAL